MTGQWGSVNGLLTSIDLLTLTLTVPPGTCLDAAFSRLALSERGKLNALQLGSTVELPITHTFWDGAKSMGFRRLWVSRKERPSGARSFSGARS